MHSLGTVRPGSTIYIPFDSFAGATGASVTLTGLAVTDVEVYKDGGVTQRASDNGYTLLDTDGIDFDGITGIHGLSISLADNSTAGFWAAGSRYFVVISSVTIDSQTVNFVAATFDIGYPDAILNTTIATLASQTSFTITSGPAEDDALNGSIVVIHDVASAVQLGYAVVLDYTGSTKTVTLAAGTTFTAAATDNISVFPPSNVTHAAAVAWASGAITAAVIATGAIDADAIADNAIDAGAIAADAITSAKIADNAIDAGSIATGAITSAKFAAGAINAAAIADGAIDAATFAADVDAEILSYLVDDATRIDASALNTASGTTIPAILTDTAEIGAAGAGLTVLATQASVNTIDDFLDTEVAAILEDTGTTIPAQIAALNNLSAAEVNAEVVDALATDTYAEPGQGAPAATTTLATKIGFLYKAWRNRHTQDGSEYALYNDDATTKGQEAVVSDDGSVFERGEVSSGA